MLVREIYIENCNKPEKRIDKSMEEKVNLEDAIVMLNPRFHSEWVA